MTRANLLGLVVLVGCGSPPRPAPVGPPSPTPAPAPAPPTAPAPDPASRSLYVRLGELPAITAVVDEFIDRAVGDPRIDERFFNTEPDKLKALVTELVCAATGGPCPYTGRDMATTHAGMDIMEDEFQALVESLVGALDKFRVPEREKTELLSAIAALAPQIVVPADQLRPIDGKRLAAVPKVAARLDDKEARQLLALAVAAASRGQRSYAEQLFTRAEMVVGPRPLRGLASIFRAGAPPRIATKPVALPTDAPPQPDAVGSSDADDPDRKPAKGSLTGVLLIDGQPPQGLGVVMLSPETGKRSRRRPKQRVIEQRGRAFAPRVLAVPVGSTVAFPNFDSVFHNVFSLSKPKQFDLGLYKLGDARTVKFDKPGVVRIGCNLHANMSAYVIVVDAPHYAVVGPDGSFRFKSLAPGKYRARAWGAAAGDPIELRVDVAAGANHQDFALAAGAAPALSPDKFGTPRQ